MRIASISVGIAILVAATFTAAAPVAGAQSAQSRDVNSVDQRARTLRLMMRPVSVELRDTRLEDIMTFIAEVTGAPLDVKWLDDRADGLERDAQVSIEVDGVTMLSFLERVLDKAGSAGFTDSTWQLTELGELEVGPKSRLNNSQVLKLYDVNDLLFELPSFTNAPTLDLDSVLDQSQGGGGGGSIFEDEESERDQLSREEKVAELIDIIINSVEPNEWLDNGGSAASIREYRGTLMVRAPDYIHRQLGGYDFWPSTPRGARAVEQQAYRDLQDRLDREREENRRELAESAPKQDEQDSQKADQQPRN